MGAFHLLMITSFLIVLLYFEMCSALPLCTDSRAPFALTRDLQFCSSNGTTCCSGADDLKLKQQFESMNVSDSGCASLLKSILCARCDQFSAQLFRVDSLPRAVPVLCNSTVSRNSTQSSQATNNFCSKVWTTCQNVSMVNSLFNPSLKASTGGLPSNSSTKVTDLWQSQADFCNAFGGASDDGLTCYAGEAVALNITTPPVPPHGLCLEKIGNGSYLTMVAHPDGSDRAFFSNQQGKIWLATIPKQGSRGTLVLDEADPFLDLTDEVYFDTEFGLLGLAFHPKFTQNGRFFVSFNCDKSKWTGCSGRCACNSDVNCDPSKLVTNSSGLPCQFHSVVAEFTVNGTGSQPSSATSANPSEVRRIFTMGLPFTGHHGGQILFGPRDGYLYHMMGDGGSTGDPFNFAQNKKSLLGKIMRFDVDNIPNAKDISLSELWGNYSIPKDNAYTDDKDLLREIWALGLRNPWRCSFDSARPSYFVCADVGQNQFEEVDLISRGGNYGWRAYEGPYVYNPSNSSGSNVSLDTMRPIFPVMGYNHSELNPSQGGASASTSASITGGYFYRSMTDPCLHGRYLYADLYGGSIWAGTENPTNSGNFSSSKIPFTCARDSPLNCTFTTPGNQVPSLSYIFSFGEDNNKDIYLLANSGVYRVVRPSRCSYTCAGERDSGDASGSPGSSIPSKAVILRGSYEALLLVLMMLLCLVF